VERRRQVGHLLADHLHLGAILLRGRNSRFPTQWPISLVGGATMAPRGSASGIDCDLRQAAGSI
jgi:hypothetical protein